MAIEGRLKNMGNCLTCFQTTTNNNEGKAPVEPTVEPRIASNIVDRGVGGGKILFFNDLREQMI